MQWVSGDRSPRLYALLVTIIHLTLSHGEASNIAYLAQMLDQDPAHVYRRMTKLESRRLIVWQRRGSGRPGIFRASPRALALMTLIHDRQ